MTPPRIILVLVDTLRADYLGCYGDPGGLTANIDRLASFGARFESAYSASNFTAPAVASLFTSLYPAVHGVYDFRIKKLPPAPLLEIAAKSGCFRKAVVDFGFFKSFLGRSFDDMESLTDLAPNWSTEGPVVETRRAAEWIARHKDESFFLFLHISAPHVPYRFPRERYVEVTTAPALRDATELVRNHPVLGGIFPSPEGDRIPEGEIERFNRASREIEHVEMNEALIGAVRDLYRMEVRVVDDVIGILVRELERLGIFESTVLSVSSDHGEELWDHGSFGHGARAMHNEVIRTPWVLTCPDRIGASRVVGESVSQTNLLPTLLDYAGFDLAGVPSAPSARYLVARDAREDPMELRSGTSDRIEKAVFSDTAYRISVVHDGFKLIAPSRRTRFTDRREKLRHFLHRVRAALSGADRRAMELFDLRKDPGERVNLAGREKKKTSALLELIGRYYKEEPQPLSGGPGDGGSDLSSSEEEQMRKELDGLGYL
jgi:choline-sulfatase